MIKFYKIFFLIIFVILTSCSSENKKISIIEESDLELQMIDAYKEGYEELEKGDSLSLPKRPCPWFMQTMQHAPRNPHHARCAVRAADTYDFP